MVGKYPTYHWVARLFQGARDTNVLPLSRQDKSPEITSSGKEQLSPVWPPTGDSDLTMVTQNQARQRGLGKDNEQNPHIGAHPPQATSMA